MTPSEVQQLQTAINNLRDKLSSDIGILHEKVNALAVSQARVNGHAWAQSEACKKRHEDYDGACDAVVRINGKLRLWAGIIIGAQAVVAVMYYLWPYIAKAAEVSR